MSIPNEYDKVALKLTPLLEVLSGHSRMERYCEQGYEIIVA
jgi:hypothetical protein